MVLYVVDKPGEGVVTVAVREDRYYSTIDDGTILRENAIRLTVDQTRELVEELLMALKRHEFVRDG